VIWAPCLPVWGPLTFSVSKTCDKPDGKIFVGVETMKHNEMEQFAVLNFSLRGVSNTSMSGDVFL
jgi:hypothetical protein